MEPDNILDAELMEMPFTEEGRLTVAGAELRTAEDRLQQFLQSNRAAKAPDLQFTQDRM